MKIKLQWKQIKRFKHLPIFKAAHVIHNIVELPTLGEVELPIRQFVRIANVYKCHILKHEPSAMLNDNNYDLFSN